jgi:hypothetical protein
VTSVPRFVDLSPRIRSIGERLTGQRKASSRSGGERRQGKRTRKRERTSSEEVCTDTRPRPSYLWYDIRSAWCALCGSAIHSPSVWRCRGAESCIRSSKGSAFATTSLKIPSELPPLAHPFSRFNRARLDVSEPGCAQSRFENSIAWFFRNRRMELTYREVTLFCAVLGTDNLL